MALLWSKVPPGLVWFLEDLAASLERRGRRGYMVEFLELEEVLMAAVDYCAYGRPYRKSTRVWNNLRQWVPQGRTGDGQCPGKGRCQSMVGSKHLKTAAGGGDRVRGKGSVARQVGGAAGAHGGAGGASGVECRRRAADGGINGQQGAFVVIQCRQLVVMSGGGSQQAVGGGGQQAVAVPDVARLRRDKRPADWSGESGRRLRTWVGSAFVRKRPGVAADRMAARRRKAANGRVDCWSVLEREHNTSQVVQLRPKARDEIRRVMRMGSGHESDED